MDDHPYKRIDEDVIIKYLAFRSIKPKISKGPVGNDSGWLKCETINMVHARIENYLSTKEYKPNPCRGRKVETFLHGYKLKMAEIGVVTTPTNGFLFSTYKFYN